MDRLACVLLAAGGSTRFGGRKQLAEINGTTMIEHTLQVMRSLTYESYVLLGAYEEEIREQLPRDTNILVNTDWQNGLSSSIKIAVEKLEDHYSHILFCLADQVRIKKADLEALISLQKENTTNIICSHYLEKNGVPAIFPRHTFASLKRLTGDQGAKTLLAGEEVLSIHMHDAQWDIDTQQQLKQFNNNSVSTG